MDINDFLKKYSSVLFKLKTGNDKYNNTQFIIFYDKDNLVKLFKEKKEKSKSQNIKSKYELLLNDLENNKYEEYKLSKFKLFEQNDITYHLNSSHLLGMDKQQFNLFLQSLINNFNKLNVEEKKNYCKDCLNLNNPRMIEFEKLVYQKIWCNYIKETLDIEIFNSVLKYMKTSKLISLLNEIENIDFLEKAFSYMVEKHDLDKGMINSLNTNLLPEKLEIYNRVINNKNKNFININKLICFDFDIDKNSLILSNPNIPYNEILKVLDVILNELKLINVFKYKEVKSNYYTNKISVFINEDSSFDLNIFNDFLKNMFLYAIKNCTNSNQLDFFNEVLKKELLEFVNLYLEKDNLNKIIKSNTNLTLKNNNKI